MKKVKLGLMLLAVCFLITGCKNKKDEVANYMVIFDTDGGSLVASQTIEKGDKIDEPAILEKDGYTFDGWYVNGEKFDFNTTIEEDIKLVAKWTIVANSEIQTTTVATNEEFTLSKSKVSLAVGKSTTIKVTTDSKKEISWKSSNEKVATVVNGKITAKSVGNATITATIGNISKTISVTVTKANTTAKTTTKSAETTKKVEENPVTTTKATTTTTTTKKAVLSYKMEVLRDENGQPDITGKVTLYILKDNVPVAGSCDITTKSGTTVNKNIPASGYITNETVIEKITNIKVN